MLRSKTKFYSPAESEKDLGGIHWRRVGHCCYEHWTFLFHVSGWLILLMLNLFASLSVNSVLLQAPYFVCPIEYSTELEQMTMSCEPSLLFRQQVSF